MGTSLVRKHVELALTHYKWSPDGGVLGTGLTKGLYGIVAFRQVNPLEDPDLPKKTHWDEVGDLAALRDIVKVSNGLERRLEQY